MTELSIQEFIHVLASSNPVPGGGGAAAFCGAIGTALGHMVGSLTAGKKKYADVEVKIRQMMDQCGRIQNELMDLAEEDAKVFAPLAEAYRLPSLTEAQKEYKSKRMEQCSKDACKVPLEIMKKCCEGIELAQVFAREGSRLAVSDAGCAAIILEGALKAAALNIFINTKTLKDREFADQMNKEALDLIREYGTKAEAIYEEIQQCLRNETVQ